MTPPRILIAGVGNIFLGDDAFGCAVVAQLAARSLPPEVSVVDFGIRGLDLSYALVDGGYDTVVLVDATPRGGLPGTVYLIEPTFEADEMPPSLVESHAMHPLNVLRLVHFSGGLACKLLLIGAEPQPLADPDEMQMELSPAIEAAVPEAIRLIESLLIDLLRQPAANIASTNL